MKSRHILVLPLMATLLSLTACSTVKDQLGLTRRMPDEFAVMTRAPLQIPPSFDGALPRPQPGMQRPQEVSPQDSAQTAVLGQPVTAGQQESIAENVLLQRAGAGQTDPNIRAVVNKESDEGAEDNRPVIKKILSIGDKKDEGPAAVLDAPGELQRMKTNKQTGQPVTTGDTPTIDD